VRSLTVASRLYAALMGAGPVVTRDVNVRRDVAVRAPDGTSLLNRRPEESIPDRYTYDPADPTPAVGGASPMTGGPPLSRRDSTRKAPDKVLRRWRTGPDAGERLSARSTPGPGR
jgi:hypothetical protein